MGDQIIRRAFFGSLVCLVIIFCIIDCGPREPAEEESLYPVTIEEVDGIMTVINPDFPKEGIHRFDLVPELSIGGADML